MTLPYNQSSFKVEKNIITFLDKITAVLLSFDIGNLDNGLKIKQVETVNDNHYKARGNFLICVAYDLAIEDSYFDNGIYQAIDLGIIKIVTAINNDGKFFKTKLLSPDNY